MITERTFSFWKDLVFPSIKEIIYFAFSIWMAIGLLNGFESKTMFVMLFGSIYGVINYLRDLNFLMIILWIPTFFNGIYCLYKNPRDLYLRYKMWRTVQQGEQIYISEVIR